MRCNCCDKGLSDAEITWNKDLEAWEMCQECLDIAYEAAYSGSFSDDDEPYEPDDDYEEGITVEIEDESYE